MIIQILRSRYIIKNIYPLVPPTVFLLHFQEFSSTNYKLVLLVLNHTSFYSIAYYPQFYKQLVYKPHLSRNTRTGGAGAGADYAPKLLWLSDLLIPLLRTWILLIGQQSMAVIKMCSILAKCPIFEGVFSYLHEQNKLKIRVSCLVLLWVQNDFGPSKSFWLSTNSFGWVQFVLVGSKSFWTGPNYKN